jgi:RHS repeat-associated protein
MPASVVRARVARRFRRAVLLALVASTVGLVTPSAAQQAPIAEPAGALSDATASGEIVSMRTRTSRTYAQRDGTYRAVISPGSLNYRGADGAWQAIDNRLVASTSPGYAYENRANRYRLSLPFDLALAPVRVEAEGAWLSFSLVGASAVVGVSGATAAYAGALPGVTLAYAALPDEVKETITLAGPSAAAGPFRFAVQASAGLAAARNDEGGIDFSDRSGRVLFSFAPPDVADNSGMAPTRERVSLALASRPGGFLVTLAVDPGWLAAPARRWPVVIDPVFEVTPSLDCQIAAGQPTTNFCSANTLRVGKDTAARRSLLKFDLSSIPAKHVTVTNAELSLYCTAKTTSNAADYVVHRVTRSWTNGATWNRYDGTNNWTNPGGDFDTREYATLNTNCATLGEKNWYPTDLVQEWADGTHPNHGLLLKQKTEGVTNVLDFGSVEHTDPAKRPHLQVQYSRWQGLLPYWTYETQQISDRTALHVNVASGNVIVHQRDLLIDGTGLDLAVDRYYNSHFVGGVNIYGRNWTLGNADDVELNTHSNGDVRWKGPSNYEVLYKKNQDGSFTTPSGINATLVKNGNTHTLTFRNKERFEFGSSDLNAHVDRNGNQLSFARNGNGDPSEITDTRGRKVTFTYNASGRVSGVTDVAGARTYTYGYDTNPLPRLTSITDPEGKTTTFGYDPTKYLTSITDPRGNQTKITYTNGLVTSIVRVTNPTNGTGPTTNFAYSDASSPCDPAAHAFKTVVTDPRNNQTTYCADRQGRVRKVIDPLGHADTTTYTNNHDIDSTTTPLGFQTSFQYSTDGRNNLRRIDSPTGANIQLSYLDTRHPDFPTRHLSPQGNAIAYAYDDIGNVTSGTNDLPAENQVQLFYITGNECSPGLPGTCKGNVDYAIDAKGNVTDFSYNAKGELSGIDRPAPLGDVSFTYDAVSRMRTMTDGKTQTTTYTYDKLDRVIRIDFHDGSSITYVFDGNGNETTHTDAAGTTSSVYDELNRLTSETHPGRPQITYTYDPADNLTSATDASGTVSYSYDNANRLATIVEPTGPGTRTITYRHDDDDRRTRVCYPNGIRQVLIYDNSARLARIQGERNANCDDPPLARTDANTLTYFQYTHTDAQAQDRSLRQSVLEKNGDTTTYVYDALDRLTKAETRNGAGALIRLRQYAYDGNSNRCRMNTSLTIVSPFDCASNGAGITIYSYNAANELTAIDGATRNYDGNGNFESSSDGWSLAYNAKDQATTITKPGSSATNATYHGASQSERLQFGQTTFSTGQLGVNSLTRPGPATDSFTRDPDGELQTLRTSGSNHYYLTDGLGSVAALTNSTGAVVNTYSYDAFGAILTADEQTPNPWRFVGAYNYLFDSETGLYKVGIRYYEPGTGRWTQPDPLDDDEVGNLYIYGGQDPINNADPDGASYVCVTCFFQLRSAVKVEGSKALARAGNHPIGIALTIAVPVGGLGFVAAATRSARLAGYWNRLRIGFTFRGTRYMLHAPHRVGASGHRGRWHFQANRGGTALWRRSIFFRRISGR